MVVHDSADIKSLMVNVKRLWAVLKFLTDEPQWIRQEPQCWVVNTLALIV